MALELRRYMANQLLRDSDVFGMAHSLEIRFLLSTTALSRLFSVLPQRPF